MLSSPEKNGICVDRHQIHKETSIFYHASQDSQSPFSYHYIDTAVRYMEHGPISCALEAEKSMPGDLPDFLLSASQHPGQMMRNRSVLYRSGLGKT